MVSNSGVDRMTVKVSEAPVKKIEDDQKTILEQSKIISELIQINKSLQNGFVQKETLYDQNNEVCYETNQLKNKQIYTLSQLLKLQTLLVFIFIILMMWVFFGSDNIQQHA